MKQRLMRESPIPTPDSSVALVDRLKVDYYAHLKTMNAGVADDATYRGCCYYYRAELLPLLPEAKTSRILDVGCGFGLLMRFCCEQGYKRVSGVEIDGQLFAATSSRLGKMAESLIHSDARVFLRGKSSSYDVITLFDVIEHFTPEQAVELAALVRQALRPGGIGVFRTPNMANLFGGYSRFIDLTHQQGYTEFSLAQLLRQSGFATPRLHLPQWQAGDARTWKLKLSRWVHRVLIGLQDRMTPQCYEKNLVMWARVPGGDA